MSRSDIYSSFLNELNSQVLSGLKEFNVSDSLDLLIQSEEEYKKTLLKTDQGQKIFMKFIEYALAGEKSNVRDIKIFFREREEVTNKILPELFRSKNSKELQKYRLNYKFMSWVKDLGSYPSKKKLDLIFNRIVDLRKKIVEKNLPLVINKARVFQFKAKKAEIDFVDLIQFATEGFMMGVDKFTPPENNNFIGVAIGYMTHRLGRASMDGHVKLTSQEKRILYRANIARFRLGFQSFNEVLDFVRQVYKDIKEEHLQAIINSTDATREIDAKHFDSSRNETEGAFEKNEVSVFLRKCIADLPIVEQKVVRLKGSI